MMTPARIVLAWAALCALAAVSFGLSFAGLGVASVPVALLIAALKVAVVAAIFMELGRARASAAIAAATALGFITLLGGLVIAERETRVFATTQQSP